MEQNQVDMVDMITNEMGENIIHLQVGELDRFFIGLIELPSNNDFYMSLTGKEVTTFFKVESIRKSKEVLKMDIMTFLANTGQYTVKFNTTTAWWIYARS